ncbi:MAG: metallophosphoesterase [Lachnospiraceae bacterium]|nr:metallophosphoesterase [Lachnospiraceae bacterium]
MKSKINLKARKNLKTYCLIILLILFAILTVWTLWGNTALMTTEFEITVSGSRLPASFSGFRIAHVSDLHNAEFGAGNAKLLRMLADSRPDIIVITGDLVDSNRTDIGVALAFAGESAKIAPTYYVTGNHEAYISQAEYETLKTGLEAAGVTVLEDEAVRLQRDGEEIALVGLADPDFTIKNDLFGEVPAMVTAKLKNLAAEETLYTILLSHRPELFDAYVSSHVDLVLSGHAHGGQFRLPLVGGLVAPNQGFFPKYDAGLFTEGSTSMIVSRGLGNSIIPLRFNNRPELILVELLHTD